MGGLKGEIHNLKEAQKATTSKMQNVEMNMDRMNFEINRLEQYPRKSSMQVCGIQKVKGEKAEERVIERIKENIEVEISAEETDIVHRVPGRMLLGNPRGILVKSISHKSKIKVMRMR